MITTMDRVRLTVATLRRAGRRVWGIWTRPRGEEPLSDLFGPLAPGDDLGPERLCTCSTRSSNHSIAFHDHDPGCRWLTVRCTACDGTGWCRGCGGEGVAEPSPALEVATDYEPTMCVEAIRRTSDSAPIVSHTHCDDGAGACAACDAEAEASELRPLAMFYDWRAQWSQATFGVGLPPIGQIEHIRRELREIEADPTDLEEWIDVVLLAMDGAWRATGATGEAFVLALAAKHEKNRARKWPAPGTTDPSKPIEHVRAEEDAAIMHALRTGERKAASIARLDALLADHPGAADEIEPSAGDVVHLQAIEVPRLDAGCRNEASPRPLAVGDRVRIVACCSPEDEDPSARRSRCCVTYPGKIGKITRVTEGDVYPYGVLLDGPRQQPIPVWSVERVEEGAA